MLDHNLSAYFNALGDPTRLALVNRLSEGPAAVSDLAAPFSISLAGVLQHLQILEAAGVVRSHKVGRVRTCEVVPEAMRTAEGWIADRRHRWERRLHRLEALLDDLPDDGETAD